MDSLPSEQADRERDEKSPDIHFRRNDGRPFSPPSFFPRADWLVILETALPRIGGPYDKDRPDEGAAHRFVWKVWLGVKGMTNLFFLRPSKRRSGENIRLILFRRWLAPFLPQPEPRIRGGHGAARSGATGPRHVGGQACDPGRRNCYAGVTDHMPIFSSEDKCLIRLSASDHAALLPGRPAG